jgi:hypothetical protein
LGAREKQDVDGRDKPGHDGVYAYILTVIPGRAKREPGIQTLVQKSVSGFRVRSPSASAPE